MGSTRLPGKTLMKVGDKYLIDHVLERLLSLVPEPSVTVATTNLDEDSILVKYLSQNYSVGIYRGSARDVQSRFLEVGSIKKAKKIVRITADDPFKDPEQILLLLKLLEESNLDYVNNFSNKIFPTGIDVEVFTLNSLIESRKYFADDENKEHVTVSLRDSSRFKRGVLRGSPQFIDTRLTIDTIKDLEFCSLVANELLHLESPFSFSTLAGVLLKLEQSR
jgi:spore coat polysaccharide biosynthesis protein SpsF (cytidylyltransferase family)